MHEAVVTTTAAIRLSASLYSVHHFILYFI